VNSTNDANNPEGTNTFASTAATSTSSHTGTKASAEQYPGTVTYTKTSTQVIPPVVYKVQIGAFKALSKEVVKKRLEKMTDAKMLTSTKDQRWLKFYFGAEGDYTSARNLKNTLQQAGFKDAFVVAFQNGRPVQVQQLAVPVTTPQTADTTANE
jgi:N-acetylmuramoyl-L-alanine amidase